MITMMADDDNKLYDDNNVEMKYAPDYDDDEHHYNDNDNNMSNKINLPSQNVQQSSLISPLQTSYNDI